MTGNEFECRDCPMADPGDCMKVGFCEHRDPPGARRILDLAARVEALSGPDRSLDGEIAETAYGWLPCPVATDARGENAGEVLTPTGKRIGGGFTYPPLGKIHRAYHCDQYTRDCRDDALPQDAIRKITAANLRAMAYSGRRCA